MCFAPPHERRAERQAQDGQRDRQESIVVLKDQRKDARQRDLEGQAGRRDEGDGEQEGGARPPRRRG